MMDINKLIQAENAYIAQPLNLWPAWNPGQKTRPGNPGSTLIQCAGRKTLSIWAT